MGMRKARITVIKYATCLTRCSTTTPQMGRHTTSHMMCLCVLLEGGGILLLTYLFGSMLDGLAKIL